MGRRATVGRDDGRGFSMIAVECDETRIDFRLKTRYVDKKAANARF